MAKTDADKLPIMMIRTRAGLTPAASFDAERLDRYAFGSTLEVRTTQRRSNPHLRLYWAILSRAVENTEGWPTSEHLHRTIKEALGYVTPRKRLDGTLAFDPDSTAFDSMDQAEWNVFFDRAMRLVSTVILPGVDAVALVKEAEATLPGPKMEAAA